VLLFLSVPTPIVILIAQFSHLTSALGIVVWGHTDDRHAPMEGMLSSRLLCSKARSIVGQSRPRVACSHWACLRVAIRLRAESSAGSAHSATPGRPPST
jgi:hypothetical protein